MAAIPFATDAQRAMHLHVGRKHLFCITRLGNSSFFLFSAGIVGRILQFRVSTSFRHRIPIVPSRMDYRDGPKKYSYL